MATKTGLLLAKTVRGNARSLGPTVAVCPSSPCSPRCWSRKRHVLEMASWIVACSSDLLGLQTTTCCHRLFQAIARYRAQFKQASFCSHCCSLANTWCIIIFTTTNTYLHVNLKMIFITYWWRSSWKTPFTLWHWAFDTLGYELLSLCIVLDYWIYSNTWRYFII